ncbi:MAG TPA: nucleotidyltransferase family protein [Longimicrobium sp.]|nr:nucleotidyltransferase family protein [Longimicrobium sp.]
MTRPHPPPATPAAHALLLGVARAALRPDGEAAEELALHGVDWDEFLALAGRNRLLPLAHRLLGDRPGVPDEVRAALRTAYARNGRQALALSGRLRVVAEAMEAAGVRALAYKGPALAVRAYGHLALRTCSDLDLLVAPRDVDAAARVLEAGGYHAAWRLTPAQDALFRRVDGDYPFVHGETGELVELHCRISSARFCAELPAAELIARARPVPIGGGEVAAPADDDLFLALCLHGAKHRWARLEWLAAAAALARRAELDLDGALDRATGIGARRTVLLALLLFRDALGMPPTESIDRTLAADPPLAELAAEARGLWLRADADEYDAPGKVRFNFRLRDGAADRVRYAARWLFTPTPEDWAWLALPDALAPLHRLLRPLRLAARHRPGRRR